MEGKIRLAVVVLLCAAAGSSQRASGGDGPRVLRGTVTDQNSRPIAHATVQIENERTLEMRSYITEARGEYHFAELNSTVDYQLEAVFDGIRSPRKTLSQFDERRNPLIDLVIRLPR